MVTCAKGHDSALAILNAENLQLVRASAPWLSAYWLVTCEIVTSGPRSQRCASCTMAWFPATCSWIMEIPGELGFPHEGLCGRRKLR